MIVIGSFESLYYFWTFSIKHCKKQRYHYYWLVEIKLKSQKCHILCLKVSYSPSYKIKHLYSHFLIVNYTFQISYYFINVTTQ